MEFISQGAWAIFSIVSLAEPLAWFLVAILIFRRDRRYYSWMILIGAIGKLLTPILMYGLMNVEALDWNPLMYLGGNAFTVVMVFGFVMFALVFHRRGGFGEPRYDL